MAAAKAAAPKVVPPPPAHKLIPGCGFLVDGFRHASHPSVKAYFLSHAHSGAGQLSGAAAARHTWHVLLPVPASSAATVREPPGRAACCCACTPTRRDPPLAQTTTRA